MTQKQKRQARFAMEQDLVDKLFDDEQRRRLEQHLTFETSVPLDTSSPDFAQEAGQVEVLVSGWGAPRLGAQELESLPALRAIFHGAGTVKTFLSDAVWERDILVTSAVAANARPVAEFTLAAILFSGKSVFEIADRYQADPGFNLDDQRLAATGNYGCTVGIVGASQIGRRVIELLRPFDFSVLISDPYLEAADPILQSVRSVELDELFRASDIVSIHAPLLPNTEGMVSRRLLGTMRPGSVLINTARAGIVDQDALAGLAAEGRIRAVLDVTDPEPLPRAHLLRGLSNVFITPHLAGAQGNELYRLGESVVREVEAQAAGLDPLHPVRRDRLSFSA